MPGEWIAPKARRLAPSFFPGQWEEKDNDVLEGRCPGEDAHSHASAPTDCRIYLSYGPAGQPPGAYCLHNSCKPRLESLNDSFRSAIFSRDGSDDPSRPAARPVEEGVVLRPPRDRENWVPDFSLPKLRGVTLSAPPVDESWFEARSPVDPRRLTPAGFIEAVFQPGDRVLVFTDFKSQGDFLWEVGRGGYRLAEKPGVKAVKSKIPTDGGKEGVWFLNNPVDGQWHGNPRRGGKPSRRSQEAVTAWRFLVLECDEEKTLHKKASLLRAAHAHANPETYLRDEIKAPPRWIDSILPLRATWPVLADQLDADAPTIPRLWMRLLAICGLPIAAIYSSGGVSWHALIAEPAGDYATFAERLRQYKARLPLIGADPAAITPVRLTRLPGCTRNGRLQRLIYLDPKASPATAIPLIGLPVLRAPSG